MTNHTKQIVVTTIACQLFSSVVLADNLPVQGEWLVEKMFINTGTERTLNYQFDDDHLVGRFLSVSPQGI